MSVLTITVEIFNATDHTVEMLKVLLPERGDRPFCGKVAT